MMTDRREGMVLITPITVSTIVMLTVMGVCYVIGHKHYSQYVKQEKRAEVQLMGNEQIDARMHTFLV